MKKEMKEVVQIPCSDIQSDLLESLTEDDVSVAAMTGCHTKLMLERLISEWREICPYRAYRHQNPILLYFVFLLHVFLGLRSTVLGVLWKIPESTI